MGINECLRWSMLLIHDIHEKTIAIDNDDIVTELKMEIAISSLIREDS